LLAAGLAGVAVLALPAGGQEPPPEETTTTTEAPPTTVSPITLPPIVTTTTTAPPPNDPGAVEELPDEPVPTIDETVPTEPGRKPTGTAAGRILRQELHVAEADAVELKSTYEEVKAKVVTLESEVDRLETGLTSLAAVQRDAVRRVATAREQFEVRAARALVRGRSDGIAVLAAMDDPNELAVANALLGSVLDADQVSLDEYTAAKREVSADLVAMADRLVDARHALEGARGELVAARRANVAAQFNLAVFAAGSDIVIHGFVFPVGDPHSFGDSFGAPRMMATEYQHAHQGTDILAPEGTPLLACERGIVTKMGSDVLGGTKLWVKGQSGTYYYYAHLSAFAPDMSEGTVVSPGDVVGFVGTTGNARGGPAHLHFEIHPDGGPAVNPYPLLKVVDDLAQAAKDREG
jgi:murein DD-endopeptidase MepM/ murein hydrolase activator NlpD